MPSVTIYLRHSLFSLDNPAAHMPAGVMILTGEALDAAGGAMTLKVSTIADARGRNLGDCALTLRVPWAKVDHVVQHEG
jgi:hypothetical protein